MRDELAGRLLDEFLTWTPEERSDWIAELRRLATHKYDTYEGFSAGERFFESFVRWIRQFNIDDARRLVKFVREELIFISSKEMNHAIACVYPDFIKRHLISWAAEELGLSHYRIKQVVDSNTFKALRRKTLYLGLSDGARLDRLRRSSPELSHEQFWLSPELGPHAVTTMRKKLSEAIVGQSLPGEAAFKQVAFVDDFYGSGTSLLYQKGNGEWGGKLARARDHLNSDLRSGQSALVTEDAHVMVVIYVASAQAKSYIQSMLDQFEPRWILHVVQPVPADKVCKDPQLVAICEWFFDNILVDIHKKVPLPLGYGRAALPLVLYHNTPNNSISPLWADSTDRSGSQNRHALFRRYERHHVDRP